MGISQITAWAIQNNPDVYSWADRPPGIDKWIGYISCIDAKGRDRLLLSSEPIFEDSEVAKTKMDEVIAAIKQMEK